MPRATTATSTPTPTPVAAAKKPRKVDWRNYGARSADDGDRATWRPSDIGDTITGRLGRVDEVSTRFGTKTLVELNDCVDVVAGKEAQSGGPYLIWPTPGLVDAFADSEADIGDKVTITLIELIDTGKGSPFKDFSVTVRF
jgi:hypothetical protein